MNHARTRLFGIDTTCGRPSTGKTVQSDRSIRKLAIKGQGRKRNSERQDEIGSSFGTANAFLRTSFLPKFQTVLAVSDHFKAESDFYKSLSQLCLYYDVVPEESRHLPYPFNVSMTMKDIEMKIKLKVSAFGGVKLNHCNDNVFIESLECLDIGRVLYYIPVVPLYEMLNDPERKRVACLLLSVFSYFYKVAEVPYYRDQSSYLAYEYEMFMDQSDDHEPEVADLHQRDFDCAVRVGDIIQAHISRPQSLECFKRRLDGFHPTDFFDQQCHVLAFKVYKLYCDFPTHKILENAHACLPSDEGDYDNTVIRMDRCVSFIADISGILGDTICDLISIDMNEFDHMEKPTLRKRFDGSVIEEMSLDFENRAFDLINELVCILEDYKDGV